jgi:hypothetical protein
MSTRSFIHVQRTDGTWARIYCHFDGYWNGVGQTLQDHYDSQELAEALMALGDISVLGDEIGEKHDFDYAHVFYLKHNGNYEARNADPEFIRLERMCNAYGRDRGEEDVDAHIGDTLEEVFSRQSYMYVWRDNHWFGMTRNDDLDALRPLKDVLAEEDEDESLTSTTTV